MIECYECETSGKNCPAHHVPPAGLAVVIALVIWGLVRLYEWWENGGGLSGRPHSVTSPSAVLAMVQRNKKDLM